VSRIGVVIIGRNEGSRLKDALQSVPAEAATVYVDSRSTDGSAELAESLGVSVISLGDGRLTAARGRQAGLDWLQSQHVELAYVQFIDGDCVLEDGWLDAAAEHLDRHADLAGVCGRRTEERRDASVWSRLIDIDWDIPAGEVPYFGGDVLTRIEAVQQVGGWNPTLIAGEEPELCFRLRDAGWRIARLDRPATRHDIAMSSFAEYRKRSRRSGHAYAEVGWLHRHGPGRAWLRSAFSILLQGLLLPVLILVGLLVWWPIGLVLSLPYLKWFAAMVRSCRRRGYGWRISFGYALVNLASRPSGAMGVVRYIVGRGSGRRAKLMEYKANPNATPAGGGA
jgi:GT2 family glycosyltransferase